MIDRGGQLAHTESARRWPKMRKREEAEEKWETPSLEWIHRVRAEHARRRRGGPLKAMPVAKQKALAAKYGLKLVSPRARAEVK